MDTISRRVLKILEGIDGRVKNEDRKKYSDIFFSVLTAKLCIATIDNATFINFVFDFICIAGELAQVVERSLSM